MSYPDVVVTYGNHPTQIRVTMMIWLSMHKGTEETHQGICVYILFPKLYPRNSAL